MQNVFYLELAEGKDGKEFFTDLQRQGIIDTYSQPFLWLDIPYYRVQFSVRSDMAKRTIALLLSNGSITWVEWVPRFEIQQSFTHGAKVSQDSTNLPSSISTKRKQLIDNPLVRFTTQEVRKESFERQWYLDEIWLLKENLSCVTTDRAKIKIAIIDNAFMAHHPSFEKSTTFSRDIADGDDDVTPPVLGEEWMHGTHGAWLIAWRKFANKWIVWTSLWSAELYLLKATSDSAQPNEITHGIEAFAKAVEMNVDIISLSRWAYMDFPIFHKIVQKAIDKGIVVIAAAGNYGSDDFFYPAAYEHVLAVWSFDKSFQQSTFSNFWSWVDIYAPGEQLVVPDSKNGFAKTDGTSASAPLFAGIYSLLLRSFWKEVSLEDFYMKQSDGLNYLDISSICKNKDEPEEIFPPSSWLIQQVSVPELLPDVEVKDHFVAPDIDLQEEIPELTFWQNIFLLAKKWAWRMLWSCLLVIAFFVRLFKKTIPKPDINPESNIV